MYTRILVPLDGSETSERALREAVRLAAGQSTRLRLCHFIDEYPMLVKFAATQSCGDAFERFKQDAADLLERARLAAAAAGVKADTMLKLAGGARVADLIVDEAAASGCDLIVIGTHGRHGFKRFALGSTAEQVARTSPVAVLLVNADRPAPPGARDGANPPGRGEAFTFSSASP